MALERIAEREVVEAMDRVTGLGLGTRGRALGVEFEFDSGAVV
ncbi:MAG: hypothetical protein WD651_12600 [Acidimicrobiia bacterium]